MCSNTTLKIVWPTAMLEIVKEKNSPQFETLANELVNSTSFVNQFITKEKNMQETISELTTKIEKLQLLLEQQQETINYIKIIPGIRLANYFKRQKSKKNIIEKPVEKSYPFFISHDIWAPETPFISH